MVQIITGEMGKGKTKELLKMVNDEVRSISGSVVYLDKTNKHMYELSNRVRLVNVKEYPVENCEQFLGFLAGIISQNNDIEKIYVDSFLKIACVNRMELENVLDKVEEWSERFQIDFVLSISLEKEQLPVKKENMVILSL